MCKFYYLNPKAPQHIKDFVAEHFSDGTRVSAVFMQEMTGGLADEGPALFNYAAAFLDETGELNLQSLGGCVAARLGRAAGRAHAAHRCAPATDDPEAAMVLVERKE